MSNGNPLAIHRHRRSPHAVTCTRTGAYAPAFSHASGVLQFLRGCIADVTSRSVWTLSVVIEIQMRQRERQDVVTAIAYAEWDISLLRFKDGVTIRSSHIFESRSRCINVAGASSELRCVCTSLLTLWYHMGEYIASRPYSIVKMQEDYFIVAS